MHVSRWRNCQYRNITCNVVLSVVKHMVLRFLGNGELNKKSDNSKFMLFQTAAREKLTDAKIAFEIGK